MLLPVLLVFLDVFHRLPLARNNLFRMLHLPMSRPQPLPSL